MKITVEFANLDEFKQYMGIESPSCSPRHPRKPQTLLLLHPLRPSRSPRKHPRPLPLRRTPRRPKRPPLRKLSPFLSLLTTLHPLSPQK